MRGATPRPWGIGRATWALCGLFAVLHTVIGMLFGAVGFIMKGRQWPGVTLFTGMMRLYFAEQFQFEFAAALAAFWLAAWVARWPVSSAPDAREWAGRGFGIFIIVAAIAIRISHALGV
jgi:hypothetical protein